VNRDGDFLLAMDIASRALERMEPRLGAELSLFHTGKKLSTHEHLATGPAMPAGSLGGITELGLKALKEGSLTGFASALQEYGLALRAAGLLSPHSAQALDSLPRAKVRAAKGCGAMGADVLAVLHEGADLQPWARANSLAPVRSLPV